MRFLALNLVFRPPLHPLSLLSPFVASPALTSNGTCAMVALHPQTNCNTNLDNQTGLASYVDYQKHSSGTPPKSQAPWHRLQASWTIVYRPRGITLRAISGARGEIHQRSHLCREIIAPVEKHVGNQFKAYENVLKSGAQLQLPVTNLPMYLQSRRWKNNLLTTRASLLKPTSQNQGRPNSMC